MKTKMEPLISVIIPVYNVELYLEKCLKSILDNTYKNLEVICINDGSTDRSVSILKKYAQIDSRVYTVSQENQGVSSARNRGLSLAKGEYIAFIDSDDYISKLYFETMMHCILEKEADLVICDALRVTSDKYIEEEGYTHIHYKRLDSKEFFRDYYCRKNVWGKLYKREILEGHIFPPNIRISEDTLFNLDVVRTLRKPVVYKTKTTLYYYVQRANSAIHSMDGANLKDIAEYYIENIISEKKYSDTWGWMLCLHVIKSLLSYRFMIRFHPDSKILTKEANIAIRSCLKELMTQYDISRFEIIKHWIMYLCPGIYTIFRLVNDPTMLKWEINENRILRSFKKRNK